MTARTVELVNEANLGKLTDKALAGIRNELTKFVETLTYAKVEAEKTRLKSVGTFARATAVQAHHREFQRVFLSLVRFKSADAANTELLTNPIAFEGANPDLKYDIETDDTRRWSK